MLVLVLVVLVVLVLVLVLVLRGSSRGGAAGVWPILPMAVTKVFINFRSRQNVMESAGESAASFPAQFRTNTAPKCYGKREGFGGVISIMFRTNNVNLGGEMGRRA